MRLEAKNALTVVTNIKLSFLNDRDPPFHTGGPPADVAEDEAEEVGGSHIEGHHYLGLVERERGEKQSTPSITSTADSHQPKRSRSAHCSQSDMPQRKEKTSTSALPRHAVPSRATHGGNKLLSGVGWRGSNPMGKILWHSGVIRLSCGTRRARGEVLRSCFSDLCVASGLCDITSWQGPNTEAPVLTGLCPDAYREGYKWSWCLIPRNPQCYKLVVPRECATEGHVNPPPVWTLFGKVPAK